MCSYSVVRPSHEMLLSQGPENLRGSLPAAAAAASADGGVEAYQCRPHSWMQAPTDEDNLHEKNNISATAVVQRIRPGPAAEWETCLDCCWRPRVTCSKPLEHTQPTTEPLAMREALLLNIRAYVCVCVCVCVCPSRTAHEILAVFPMDVRPKPFCNRLRTSPGSDSTHKSP